VAPCKTLKLTTPDTENVLDKFAFRRVHKPVIVNIVSIWSKNPSPLKLQHALSQTVPHADMQVIRLMGFDKQFCQRNP
jgi:hypothetical protein